MEKQKYGYRRRTLSLLSLVVMAVFGSILPVSAHSAPRSLRDVSHTGRGTVAPLPSLRVTLSQPLYFIRNDPKTGAPRMPQNVSASAVALHWPIGAPAPGTFRWNISLTWTQEDYETRHCIEKRVFEQPSPIKVDLSDQLRGGTLKVMATAMLQGKIVKGVALAQVAGENPTRQMVLERLPRSRYGLMFAKIGMWESGLHQFFGGNTPGRRGMPYLSETRDVGIMQLNIPCGSVTSPDQVWDWRANLSRGFAIFRSSHWELALASRHANRLHRVPQTAISRSSTGRQLPVLEPPMLSDVRGTGCAPGDRDPDGLALSQREREAIRRYNGGREYKYLSPVKRVTACSEETGWQIDPTRGGIRPTSGDPDYVRHVLLAQIGVPWPSPRKRVTLVRRHHTRLPQKSASIRVRRHDALPATRRATSRRTPQSPTLS